MQPSNMVQTSQCMKELQATKLKQEDQELYKEKMEVTITEYKLAKEDPAIKITLQSIAKA